MPKRPIEREFGVPIAGEIQPPERWTRTGLKRLPGQGPLCWEELFGRDKPVVLDLGCGNGRFLIGSAVWRPGYGHLGVDVLPLVIRYATRRANQRGLTNIRFTVMEAHRLLDQWIAPHTVAEIHCYHPQPYYEPHQAHRRLISPSFLALVHRALVPSGQLYIQTDNPGYWQYIRAVTPVFFDFEEHACAWPDAPKGRTRREIIALRRGLAVFRGQGRAKSGLSEDKAIGLAAELPPPVFDADRRLRELDHIENEPGP